MEDPSPASGANSPQRAGLFRSLRNLLATLAGTARARLELLQVELEEEKLRLAGIALFAVAAVFFIALAIVLLTLLVILLFWDTHRVLATGLLALGYLVIGIACAMAARQRAAAKSRLFASSLAQLEADKAGLTSGD